MEEIDMIPRNQLAALLVVFAAIALCGCGSKKRRSPDLPPTGQGEFTLVQIFGGTYDTRFVLPGDFDGDTDLDLFLANHGEQNRLYINDGSGEYTDGTGIETPAGTGLPVAQNFSTSAAAADVDGDGDTDIVVVNNGQNILLINDGAGRFTDGTDLVLNLPTGLPPVFDDSRAVAFINIDQTHGDLDPDLVVINSGQNKLYLNDGNGEFLDGTDLTQTLFSGLPVDNDAGRSIKVLDIDGDGDLDFFVGNDGGPVRIYLNSPTRVTVTPEVWQDGWGEYIDTTFDTTGNAVSLPYFGDTTWQIETSNLDSSGDGSLDLVLANDGTNRVLLNNGVGLFQDAEADWNRERLFARGDFFALHGEGTQLFAVGNTGQISHRPDLAGGTSWAVAGGLTGADLLCVDTIPGTSTTFAGGKSGVVVENYSQSPGFNLTNQGVTPVDLNGCAAISLTDVYFAGDGGTVLHAAWNSIQTRFDYTIDYEFSASNLNAVHGTSGTDVRVVGFGNAVLHYNGTSWSRESTGLTTPGSFNGVHYDSSTNVFAVGAGGLILRYHNPGTGLGWYQETSPTTFTLNAVTGTGSSSIRAVGNIDLINADYNILGFDGSTWTSMGTKNFQNLWVSTPTGAFNVGETVTGAPSGASATVLGYDAVTGMLTVQRTGATTFSLTGPDTIMGQTSGSSGSLAGLTQVLGQSQNLNDVYMHTSGDIFASGEYGTLIRYDAAGGTWEYHTLVELAVGSPTTAYVQGETVHGSISLASAVVVNWDGGNNILTVNRVAGNFDLLTPDQITGASSGAVSTLSTVTAATTASLRGICGVSATDCYAVGTGPTVLHYTGSGNWTPVSVPGSVTADLNGAYINGNNLYVVGDSGTILHYDTSTTTWNTSIVSPVTEDLLAIWGSGSDLFAAGENGTIIHYNGTSWFVEAGGTLNDISASAANDIWAVGDYGWILHKTGAGWSPVTDVPTSQDLLGVYAQASNNVVAVGRAGTVLRWDGGTWTLENPTSVDLYAVHIFGSGDILACGDSGVVVRYNGATWSTYYNTGTTARLTGIWGDSINNAWVVGHWGTCLHYTGGASVKGFDTSQSATSRAVAVVDVNIDSYPDLIFGNNGANTLWLNTGVANPGYFALDGTGRLPADTDDTYAIAKGNFDGTWPYQLVLGNTLGQTRLYIRNSGTGDYEDRTDLAQALPTGLPATRISSAPALADVDNDGDFDVLVAVRNAQNRLYINSGGSLVDGTFDQPQSALPADTDDSRDVALADIDGNGQTDAVFANYGSQNKVYLNTGGGVFTDSTATLLPADTDASSAVALGDLNGDGTLDMVFANYGGQNRVYIFNAGSYQDQTAVILPTDTAATTAVRLADVDNDTDLDILFFNEGEQDTLYLNQIDLTGLFLDVTVSSMPSDTAATWAASVGDLNGDGAVDIVLATDAGQNRLYLNTGAGVFQDRTDITTHLTTGLPTGTYLTRGTALGDFDRDGDLDLITVNWGEQNRLYFNDGSGLFSDETDELKILAWGMPVARKYATGLGVGDLDGDGDLDLLVTNAGPDEVLENR
jgi:photosystem II stability/assembly factor-like uncharacterized protein